MLVLIACIVQWISSGSHRCCISKSTCRILCVVVRSCEEFFLGVCKVADSMNVFEHFRCSVSLLPSVFSPWHSSGIYLEQLLSLRQLSSYCSPHLCHLDFLNRFWSSLKEYSNPVWLLCRLHFSNSWRYTGSMKIASIAANRSVPHSREIVFKERYSSLIAMRFLRLVLHSSTGFCSGLQRCSKICYKLRTG